jgi:hypothetical protein
MKVALDPHMFRTVPLLDLPALAAELTSCVFAWEDRARESSLFMRRKIDEYLAGWTT